METTPACKDCRNTIPGSRKLTGVLSRAVKSATVRGERTCDRTAEREYELPPSNADCHLTVPIRATPAQCGENITHQSLGLALGCG